MGSSGIILNSAHQSCESRVCLASTPPCSLHTSNRDKLYINHADTFPVQCCPGQTPDEATCYSSVISAINYLTAFSFLLVFSFLLLCQTGLSEKETEREQSKKHRQNDSNLVKTATRSQKCIYIYKKDNSAVCWGLSKLSGNIINGSLSSEYSMSIDIHRK